jgi:deoxycytidylate deaminase
MQSDSELVIGLVAPVGANLEAVVDVLTDRFRHFQYQPHLIRLSELVTKIDGLDQELVEEPAAERLHSYMNAGNQARHQSGRGDFLALSAIYQIARTRQGEGEPLGRVAHILRSLKHPDEVATLREVYGAGFFLVGVHAPRQTRLDYLIQDKNIPAEEALKIIDRDEAEEEEYGQQTRDTFELCDAFVAVHQPDFKQRLWRILDLLFGDPFQTPTRDEYAMFMAYAASLRSADLSRQVGAVILSEGGELIATGANDVPRFGGGQYWAEEGADQRDYVRGYDSNAKRRNDIILDVVRRFGVVGGEVPDDEALQTGKALLQDSGILDLTEYGRAVHAEMEAILSCTRAGASPLGGTLFSTTFPCHNCAKHIVAAGLKRVVYVEPYPKSQAQILHGDAIEVAATPSAPGSATDQKVFFEPFVGVGPRRFSDLFALRLSTGKKIVRSRHGDKLPWNRATAQIRVPLSPISYLDREKLLTSQLHKITENGLEESREDTNGPA